ncbi:MAG: iron ABC transporter permease, partial [Roseburia sp.]|nr:iron ABC transporter permease [Roseburia sp.]
MQHSRKIRYIIAFLLLGISVLVLIAMNVCIGTVKISLEDIIVSIGGRQINNSRILWDIRMPRTMAALILGGALALAGYLLQTFFHNPIAGPFVLGISSGAKMVVALVMVFLMGQAIRVSSVTLIAAAFLGAMISMGFVLLMSRKVNNMSMLVVSGVMIGYICSAVTELVVTFANDAEIVNLHNWSRGSFSGMTWDNVIVMAVVITVTFVIVFFMAKPLSAYQLGESYAQNMGVN